MRRDLVRWIAALVLAGAGFVGLAAGIYLGYSSRVGAAVDLFLPWWAVREALARGGSPYGDAIGAAARAARFYGDPPPLPLFPYHFAYPLYFAFFIAPVLPLPYPWAAAAWMALLSLATAALVLLLCHELAWPATVAGRALVALAGALWYPSLISIVLGQITPIVLLLLVGAVAALRRGHDLSAGALLAATTVKPQLIWLAVSLVLLNAARHGQWRLPAGFALGWAALVALPMLWLPAWPREFAAGLGSYAGDEPVPSALLLLGQLGQLAERGQMNGTWEGTPAALAAAGGVALTAALLVWWWWRRPDGWRLLAMTLAVTLVVTPLRALTAQMALLVVLLWALRRMAAQRAAAAATCGALAFVAGWGLILSRTDPPEYLLRQLLPPLAGLILAVVPGVSTPHETTDEHR